MDKVVWNELFFNTAKTIKELKEIKEGDPLSTVFDKVQLGQHNDVKAAEMLNLLGDKK